jgi:peptidyl-prolyl cis-trans isomerase C
MRNYIHRNALALIIASMFATAVSGVSAADTNVDTSQVLVSWKDLSLTRHDFDVDLQRVPEESRHEFRRDMKRITGSLENLLVYRTLAAEARELGLDKEADVRKAVELATDKVLGLERLNRFRAQVQVPDMVQSAKEKYLAEQSKFMETEKVRVMHVLVDIKSRSDEEARQRAEQVHEQAVKGADFGQLVQEFSDDLGSKGEQGDLGYFGKGRMVPQFEQAAFALSQPGDLSPVVKTRFGYHVLRLVDRKPAILRSFEEVRESLVREFQNRFVNDRVKEYLSEIRNDKSIKMNTEAIDALQVSIKAAPVSSGGDAGR